jgi:hypothetical protein
MGWASGIGTELQDQCLMEFLDKHIRDIVSRNTQIVSPHMQRVGRLASRMAVVMDYSLMDCIRVAEGGVFHDIGKSHPVTKEWIRKHQGVEVTPQIRRSFRILHSKLGGSMLIKADLDDVMLSIDDLGLVCRCHHHHPYQRLPESVRRVIGPIQVADYLDARTVSEGEHCHRTITITRAIDRLKVHSQEYMPGAIDALVLCQNL